MKTGDRSKDPASALQTAMAFHRKGDIAAAESGYRDVLARAPGNVDALHLLGTVVAAKGDPDSGAALIRRALAINPNLPEAHFNLGNILTGGGHFDEAEPHFRKALALQPANAEAANNLGGALLRLDRAAEAEASIRRALELDPASINARANLAAVMDATGRFDETLALYDAILQRRPDDVITHHHRALALLLRERFTEGWAEFAWRMKLPDSRGYFGRFPYPYWQGEALAGHGLLIWTEQGPGDEILMGTMFADALAQAARVVLVCSPRLAPLFRRSFPAAAIIAADGRPKDGSLLAGITLQASMSDLGRWLRPAAASFAPKAYLAADPACVATLRAKYQAAHPGKFLVGISWRSRAPESEREKTVSLSAWREILKTPGVAFINLQYGDTAAERAEMARAGIDIVHDPDVDPLTDMDTFAAQTAAVDLVISASNTTVHVAGALGKPVWALIPSNRGRLWYWFLGRTDSPWYPGLRLYRQAGAGWGSALESVSAALGQWRDAP